MDLYHYTTLETIALILESKKLLFNRLSCVDDLNEGLVDKFGDVKNYVYVSCWSENACENISLWNMYSNNYKGVRIKLNSKALDIEIDDKSRISNLSNEEMNYFIDGKFLNPINYVTKEEELKIKYFIIEIIKPGQIRYNTDLSKIGLTKLDSWRFQDEIRFRIFGIPTNDFSKKRDIKDDTRYNIISMGKDFKRKYSEHLFVAISEVAYEQPENNINHIFVPIKTEHLAKSDFLLGPKTTRAEEILLEALIEKYIPNFDGKIKRSHLMIR